jgi:hypothetical protein
MHKPNREQHTTCQTRTHQHDPHNQLRTTEIISNQNNTLQTITRSKKITQQPQAPIKCKHQPPNIIITPERHPKQTPTQVKQPNKQITTTNTTHTKTQALTASNPTKQKPENDTSKNKQQENKKHPAMPAKTETTTIPTDITNGFVTAGKKNKTTSPTTTAKNTTKTINTTITDPGTIACLKTGSHEVIPNNKTNNKTNKPDKKTNAPHTHDPTDTKHLNKWIAPKAHLPSNMHVESESKDEDRNPAPPIQNMSIVEDNTVATTKSIASTLSWVDNHKADRLCLIFKASCTSNDSPSQRNDNQQNQTNNNHPQAP